MVENEATTEYERVGISSTTIDNLMAFGGPIPRLLATNLATLLDRLVALKRLTRSTKSACCSKIRLPGPDHLI
jgi:hypothetical protein